MLELVRMFPAIASLVLLLGGGLSGFAVSRWYEWIAIPHALALQRESIEAEYRRRVAEAIAAEQLRQFHILERLTDDWQRQLEEERAWQQAHIDMLEEEIADYEKAKGDGACRLDQADLDFLAAAAGGVRDEQPAAPRR